MDVMACQMQLRQVEPQSMLNTCVDKDSKRSIRHFPNRSKYVITEIHEGRMMLNITQCIKMAEQGEIKQ